MATRLYFTRATSDIQNSPSYDASWEQTSTARALSRFTLGFNKGNTALTGGGTSQVGSGVDPNDVAYRMFVSPPLGQQTLSGTVKGYIRVLETNIALSARVQLLIKVVSFDGLTTRGTILSHNEGALASEFATSATNRALPLGASTAITTIDIVNGDRIVVEIGARIHATNVANTFTYTFGDPTGTAELPENETDTSSSVPWLEFSQNLAFTSQMTLNNYMAPRSVSAGVISVGEKIR